MMGGEYRDVNFGKNLAAMATIGWSIPSSSSLVATDRSHSIDRDFVGLWRGLGELRERASPFSGS